MVGYDNICRVQYNMPEREFNLLLGDRDFEEMIHAQMAALLAGCVEEKLKVTGNCRKNYDYHTFEDYIEFSGSLAIMQVDEFENLIKTRGHWASLTRDVIDQQESIDHLRKELAVAKADVRAFKALNDDLYEAYMDLEEEYLDLDEDYLDLDEDYWKVHAYNLAENKQLKEEVAAQKRQLVRGGLYA